jgi:hypothetical protein
MENYPHHEIPVKFATDPLDCDVDRVLTLSMRTERAIVAGLLHHLLQFGISVPEILDLADPCYPEDHCVMEWVFQRDAGEVELVVGADEQPAQTILLTVGAGARIVRGWRPVTADSELVNDAMADFYPDEFYPDEFAAKALLAASAEPEVRDGTALRCAPATPALLELIRTLDESSCREDCPKGLTFVDTVALQNLVRAARLAA